MSMYSRVVQSPRDFNEAFIFIYVRVSFGLFFCFILLSLLLKTMRARIISSHTRAINFGGIQLHMTLTTTFRLFYSS